MTPAAPYTPEAFRALDSADRAQREAQRILAGLRSGELSRPLRRIRKAAFAVPVAHHRGVYFRFLQLVALAADRIIRDRGGEAPIDAIVRELGVDEHDVWRAAELMADQRLARMDFRDHTDPGSAYFVTGPAKPLPATDDIVRLFADFDWTSGVGLRRYLNECRRRARKTR
jgi:hypothetical protein